MMIGAAAIACALLVSARGLAQDESPTPIAEEKQEAAQGRADDGDDVTERPQAGAEDPLHAQLIRGLLDHLRKTDELNLTVPDFPQGKEWFNSLPLSFERELKGKIVILD
ncbi:MAG TPA: hypothetical protein VK116_05445, partial [Planctomycetota bacterium]|nr:hypothetical protein [Planctomycetota bacterium]